MKSLLIAGSFALALASGSAMAADMAVKAPVMMPPPAPSWTGCFINLGVGYGLWDQQHSFTSGATGVTFAQNTGGGDGWLGRVGAGCDYQFSSSWVLGIFGDYDWTNLQGSMVPLSRTTGADEPLLANETETGEWAIGGRLGYLVAPNVMTYFTGGWTEARFGQMNLFTRLGTPIANAFPAATYSGYFLGGGTEYNLTFIPIPGLFVRTEYRYGSYQSQDLAGFNATTGVADGNVLHSSKKIQTITTSLVWRFGWH
jgi:outer membrane immunogenic protein